MNISTTGIKPELQSKTIPIVPKGNSFVVGTCVTSADGNKRKNERIGEKGGEEKKQSNS